MHQMPFGSFCWSELLTPNVKAAKDFYGKLLHWEFTDHDTQDAVYTIITVEGKEFAGIWEIPKDQQKDIPPHWMGYILVENLEQTLTEATELGATVKKAITSVGDFGRFAIIADPTGACIAFWESTGKTCCDHDHDHDHDHG